MEGQGQGAGGLVSPEASSLAGLQEPPSLPSCMAFALRIDTPAVSFPSSETPARPHQDLALLASLKAPSPNTLPLGLSCQHTNLGGTQFPPQHPPRPMKSAGTREGVINTLQTLISILPLR